jgi:hypothetical protein
MKSGILAALLITAAASHAPAEEFDLKQYARRTAEIQQAGMITLGSWAVANIAGNSALLVASDDYDDFALMNLGWAGINLGLATIGYRGASIDAEPSLRSLSRRQRRLEHAFLFNTGLDVGYVFAGLWLTELANRSDRSEQLAGFGSALIVQGSFLFAFDLVMYLIQGARGRALYQALPAG